MRDPHEAPMDDFEIADAIEQDEYPDAELGTYADEVPEEVPPEEREDANTDDLSKENEADLEGEDSLGG
jgi:hypothetical protein